MFQARNVKNSLEIFHPVFDEIEDGIIVISNSGTILYANPTILEMMGYKIEDLVNRSFLSVRELNWINRNLSNKKKIKLNCKGCNKIQWVSISVQKIGDNDTVYILHKNAVINTQRRFTVVKKNKLTKNSIKDRKSVKIFPNLLIRMFDELDVGLVLYSYPDFKVVAANNSYLDFFSCNFTTTNIVGLTYEQYFNNSSEYEVLDKAWRNYIPKVKGFVVRELAISTKDSEQYCRFKVSPIKSNGKIKYWLEVVIDITDQVKLKKEAIKLARENEEKISQFNALIDSMTDSVWIFDKNARLVDVNKAAEEIFDIDIINEKLISSLNDANRKIDSKDINGKNLTPDEFTIYQALNGLIIKDREGIVKNVKTGKDVFISSSASPIYTKDGHVDGAVIVIRDISDRIIARKQREELNNMKDEFIAIISHELRTPISVIDTALQSMLSLYKEDLTPRVKRLLGKIKQNSFRLVKLSNNFLDITKAHAGFIKPYYSNVDIVVLTKEIVKLVSLYAKSKGIELSLKTPFKKKIIALDQDKYERILMNLLSNSIKFTPKGQDIIVAIYLENNQICISVKDSGIGIPKENLNKIFDRFVQVGSTLSRKNEGTGLGLSIAKLLVNSLDGEIIAKSEEGVGSEFIIYLPDKSIEKQIIDNENNNFISKDYLSKKTDIEFSDIYLDTK